VSRDSRIVAAFLAAVAAAVLLASVACTWAIAAGASPKWRLPFRLMCHGMTERSFDLFGATMPICARCTGIYVGLIAGVVFFALVPIVRERLLRVVLFAAAAPMAIDGLTQATGLRESTNLLRVATGFAAAFAFGMWALCELETQARRRLASP
jgi:uncharacterized membrane protein